MNSISAAAILSIGCMIACSVHAQTITSPVAITATFSYPDPEFGTAANLINHGGLINDFVSGVTDFDSYIASNPQHTILSEGAEWFTDFNVPVSTITLDMGSALRISRLAVWTDEFWGAGLISVGYSLTGESYASLGSFAPTDWPTSVTSYGADVFSFAPQTARFIRLELSGCPQLLSSPGGGCGLGEIAFATVVPEPSAFSLLGLGLLWMSTRVKSWRRRDHFARSA